MMMDSRSEEELAPLKAWWEENGNFAIIGMILAIAIFVGIKFYKQHKTKQLLNASNSYNAFIDATITKTQDTSFETLQNDDKGTIYADYAALIKAAEFVNVNKLTEAKTLLENVVKSSNEIVATNAKLRLTQVLIADAKLDEAEKLLNTVSVKGFEQAKFELLGDIFVAKGDLEKAGENYAQAVKLLKTRVDSSNLFMKLNDTGFKAYSDDKN